MTTKKQMVMVTTEARGVFAGYLVGKATKERVKLRESRMCVRWTSQMRGVEGLAALGPSAQGRVSPAVPEKELFGITSVTVMTAEAAERWEAEPWG